MSKEKNKRMSYYNKAYEDNCEVIEKESGITLIALVITIIIIIILSTVTINIAFGNSGLIMQTEIARDMELNSIVAEQEQLNKLLSEIENILVSIEKNE